jgi:DNA-binding transcriptional MerR regulator
MTKKNKTAKQSIEKRPRKRTNRKAKPKRGPRLPFTPVFAKRLGYECSDMAEADIELHRARPRLRKTLAEYAQKYSEIGRAFERGQLLRNLRACAGAIMTVSQTAKKLGFDHSMQLRELLDSDAEINSLWEQTRIDTVAKAKTALVKVAEEGNQQAIKAIENFLYDEGEGRGGSANINYAKLTVSQMAELFGVTRQTIHAWYTKNGLPRAGDGTINLKDAIRWFEGFTKSKVTDTAPLPSDALRNLKAEQMKLNLAERRHDLLDRAEVIGGLAARWQKITSGFRYRTRELATMVHSQTVEKTTDILRRFFGELQEGWLDVPEFLYLPADAEKKYIELMETLKEGD